jgi:hypothetical protein
MKPSSQIRALHPGLAAPDGLLRFLHGDDFTSSHHLPNAITTPAVAKFDRGFLLVS